MQNAVFTTSHNGIYIDVVRGGKNIEIGLRIGFLQLFYKPFHFRSFPVSRRFVLFGELAGAP